MKFDAIQRAHVLQAIAECDALNEREDDGFLKKYGFGPARKYLLRHDGRSYDSKAILGVARKFANPKKKARFVRRILSAVLVFR